MSNLIDTFVAKYGQSDTILMVKSPLRICPIGAHTDYQGGRVTGMTLDASVDMVYVPREDSYVEIQSEDFPDTELFSYGHDLEYIPGFWGILYPWCRQSTSRRPCVKSWIECSGFRKVTNWGIILFSGCYNRLSNVLM